MFPFRPSRAAIALLELAEAMLAPEAFEQSAGDDTSSAPGHRSEVAHPHRRAAAIERRRRPAPPQPEHTCLAPLTRTGRAREAQLRS